MAQQHPDWALGFLDETWWSRVAQPQVHSWVEPQAGPLRLVEQEVATTDPDPKALACYGVLVRRPGQPGQPARDERVWLRFVEGRPVSALTEQFLAWCCAKLQEAGVPVWVLIWDNASWHVSKRVRTWIRAHNRQVKQQGQGVRIVPCYLPVKSPGSIRRAHLGAWQARHRRAGPPAQCAGGGRPGLCLRWLLARAAPRYSRQRRMIMH